MMKSLRYFLIALIILSGSSIILPQSFQYISPKDNSILVSLSTNIILRSDSYVDPSSLSPNEFSVVGSLSGEHYGIVKLSDDNKTILFRPTVPFSPNEEITVNVSQGIKTTDGNALPSVVIHFKTTPLAHPLNINTFSEIEKNSTSNTLNLTPIFKSHHKYTATDTLPPDFPQITVDTSNNPAPGDIFITNQALGPDTAYGNYLMIYNNNGTVAEYKKLPQMVNLFKMELNGNLSYAYRPGRDWIILDTTMTPIDTFQCGNGYKADAHGFLLLPNGHALLFANDPEPVDMSKVVPGGDPNATVIGAVIQELDASKNVIFQWRTWDYLPITDSYFDLTAHRVDLIHMNDVTIDKDGNIIASLRHLSSIIKINRETGNIMWILGGKQNEFTFVNEHPENAPTYFSYQHDVSILPNGDITLFDNGNQHPTQYSRGVEYDLDRQNKIATLVWEFRHSPDIYAGAMGSVERLPNGNTIIGWGIAHGPGIPTFTEVHPDNSIALEFSLPSGLFSYRSYKYPWVSQHPEASVTLEILQSNTYTFDDNTDTTGITITFNQLTGGGNYTYATVTRYNYAPLNPSFTTDAPNVVSNYFTIEGTGIISYTGDVVVDLNYYPAVLNPNETIIYASPDNSNSFTALPTSYDSTMNELTFTTSNLGKFIFGVPQVVDSAYAPFPIAPKDSEFVNGEAPVKLVWGTRGIVQTYHLQVSTDPSFNNLVVDNSNLTSTIYTLNSVNNNSTYYWRVNNTNSAGTSEWSTAETFFTASPFISMIFPNGGESIYLDSTYIVRWQTNINDTVNIELFKGGNFDSIIADTIVSGTHAINWHVSPGISVDSSYKVKVSSIEAPSVFGISDTTFRILSNLNGISDNTVKLNHFDLYQNYPNPFNPSTVIKYSIPEESRVKIKIYNIIGQQVVELVDAFMKPGSYSIKWNAINLSSGVYFYSIRSTGISGKKYFKVKKMLLLK